MTQPTHTHRAHGGRFAQVASHAGTGPLDGQTLVIYHDLDKDVQSATTVDDWNSSWRPIAPNDCSVCLGTGHDQIKGDKRQPCGGCYGLGKVRDDGETPADCWELAAVATGIIQRQKKELDELRQFANNPAVQALIEQQRQQTITDSMGKQYQEWAGGSGHGPGGKRYTGD
ncbi:hypothetical protein [Halomonas halocynthiae]|uniref:hypothetical protein n=1 Tax=Halomonas halocynthiae TaxID=176290 RepID=UPI0004252AB2|nr:hypothetical protein [Halomonas halocynthiae]